MNLLALALLVFQSPAMTDQPWSLPYAAAHGQTSVVSMLLKLKVDANQVGVKGDRPLDISCLKGDAATTRVLLEFGANPNLRNQAGATPLHDAALNGNREVVELLLMKGADANAVAREDGSTPLHYAASFGRLEAVALLVKYGADVTRKNAAGVTAVQLADRNNHTEISKFLTTR